MVYVRSRKFCCCLPVRFGVFIMSLGSTLFSGFIATVAIIAIIRNNHHELDLDHNQRIGMFALAGIYSAFALFSLMGFFGCLARKRGLVLAYSWLSYILLALSVGVGILNIYHLFHKDNSKTIDDCVKGINDKTDTDFNATDSLCKNGTKVISTGIAVAATIVLVIYWLVTLYGCHIISSYVGQLSEEEDAEERSAPPPMVVAPGAGPQPTYYPFNAPQNAYGYGKA